MSKRQLPNKPIQLRLIFILNALMAILPFVFFLAFKDKPNPKVPLDHLLLTGAAYILTFVLLVRNILRQNSKAIRAIIAVNFIIALPTKAFIGMAVALISIILSFTKKVTTYFSTKL